jgi:hypothetical protein
MKRFFPSAIVVLLTIAICFVVVARRDDKAPSREVKAEVRTDKGASASAMTENTSSKSVQSLNPRDGKSRSVAETGEPKAINRLVDGTLPKTRVALLRRPINISVMWRDLNEMKSVDLNAIRARAKFLTETDPELLPHVGDRDLAFKIIYISIAMARPPEVAFEDENHYYFSGGATTYSVNDFSAGLMLSKDTGKISTW